MIRAGMKRMGHMAAALCIAALAGCAAPVQNYARYEAPAAGPKAKVTFKALLGPNSRYQLLTYDNPQNCSGARLVAASGDAAAPMTTVRADAMATFSVRIQAGGTCALATTFLPRAGHSYNLTSVEGGGRCSLLVDDTTATGSPHPELSAVSRLPSRRDGTCAPLAAPLRAGAQGDARTPAPTLNDFKDILPAK